MAVSEQSHYIKRLNLELSLLGEDINAGETNLWIDSNFTPTVITAIERVLEEYTADSARLENLIIDLGALTRTSGENLQSIVVDANEIEEKIRQYFYKILGQPNFARSKVEAVVQTNLVRSNVWLAGDTVKELIAEDDVITFLLTGMFPWYVHNITSQEIFGFFTLHDNESTAGINYVSTIEHIYDKPEAINRLLLYINDSSSNVYAKLLNLLKTVDPFKLKSFLNQVSSIRATASYRAALQITEALLEVFYVSKKEQIEIFISAKKKSKVLSSVSWHKINKILIENLPVSTQGGQSTTNTVILLQSIEKHVTTTEKPKGSTKPKINIATKSTENTYDILPLEKGALHSKYCGLLLLGPFIPQYFRAIGLIQHETFANELKQARAVQLLAYLATGECILHEPDSAILKIISGLDIQAAVAPRFKVTKKIKQQNEQLLTAIIDHWKVLGKTSPQTLREVFLQRPGILQKEGADWRVILEKNTIDILLEKIPWGFGTIKMPWNKFLIHVDWTS